MRAVIRFLDLVVVIFGLAYGPGIQAIQFTDSIFDVKSLLTDQSVTACPL